VFILTLLFNAFNVNSKNICDPNYFKPNLNIQWFERLAEEMWILASNSIFKIPQILNRIPWCVLMARWHKRALFRQTRRTRGRDVRCESRHGVHMSVSMDNLSPSSVSLLMDHALRNHVLSTYTRTPMQQSCRRNPGKRAFRLMKMNPNEMNVWTIYFD